MGLYLEYPYRDLMATSCLDRQPTKYSSIGLKRVGIAPYIVVELSR
jgi:hypothetical protein